MRFELKLTEQQEKKLADVEAECKYRGANAYTIHCQLVLPDFDNNLDTPKIRGRVFKDKQAREMTDLVNDYLKSNKPKQIELDNEVE